VDSIPGVAHLRSQQYAHSDRILEHFEPQAIDVTDASGSRLKHEIRQPNVREIDRHPYLVFEALKQLSEVLILFKASSAERYLNDSDQQASGMAWC
jgi:hypothetical protein